MVNNWECFAAMAEGMLDYVLDLSLMNEVFTEHRSASLMARFGATHYPEPSTSTSVSSIF